MHTPDFADIRGNDAAVIAIANAARMRASAILIGPPGTGKTMIARRVPGLLAPLDDHAQRWLTAEYHGAGFLGTALGFVEERPFRAPHHTISCAALVGDGFYHSVAGSDACMDLRGSFTRCPCRKAVPHHLGHLLPRSVIGRCGEVQLARFGVLFLDEVTEFPIANLRALGATLRRMGTTAPMIIASATRCGCGWFGDQGKGLLVCDCTEGMRARHWARVEQACTALLIDQVIAVHSVSLAEAKAITTTRSTADLRAEIGGVL